MNMGNDDGGKRNLNALSWIALVPALNMFDLQIYFLDDHRAVVLEDLCDLSDLAFLTAGYYLRYIPDLYLQRKAVGFVFLLPPMACAV